MCTSRAWRNVLAAAYPDERVRWLSIYAAYAAGVGVNAIFPARAGDVVRLTMAHRAVNGLDVHDARQLEPGSRHRRRRVRDRPVHVGGDAGCAPRPGRAPVPAELRLRLVHRPRARLGGAAAGGRDRRHRSRRLDSRERGRVPAARRPGIHGRPDTDALAPHRGRVAARRLGSAARDGVVHARCLPHRAVAAQRAPRPGDPEPRNTRAGEPGWSWNGAGVPRLHPARAGITLRAPRLQRRHEADAHGRQRRDRVHRDPADAAHAALPPAARSGCRDGHLLRR